MLRVDRDGRAVGRLAIDDLVPPDVAAFGHRHVLGLVADPAGDQDVLDRGGFLEGLVDGRLELRRLAAPPAAVGGDDELRL